MYGKRRSMSRVTSAASRMLSPSNIGLAKKKKKTPAHEGLRLLRYTKYYPSEPNISEEMTVLSPTPSEIARGLSNPWTGLDRRWKMSQDALAKFGHLFKKSSRSEMEMRQDGRRIKSGSKRKDGEEIQRRPMKPGLSEEEENELTSSKRKGESRKAKKRQAGTKGSSSSLTREVSLESRDSRRSTSSRRKGSARASRERTDEDDWHSDREDSLDVKRRDLRPTYGEPPGYEYDSHDRKKKAARRTSSASLDVHGSKRKDKRKTSTESADEDYEDRGRKLKAKRQHSYESDQNDDDRYDGKRKHKERSSTETRDDDPESRGHKRKSKRSHSMESMDGDDYIYDTRKKDKAPTSTGSVDEEYRRSRSRTPTSRERHEDELDYEFHKKKVKRSGSKDSREDVYGSQQYVRRDKTLTAAEFSDDEMDKRRSRKRSISKESIDDLDDGHDKKKRTRPSKDSFEDEYDSHGKRKKKSDSKDSVEDEFDSRGKRKKKKSDSKDSIEGEHDTHGKRKKKSDSKESVDDEYESHGKRKKKRDTKDSPEYSLDSPHKKKKVKDDDLKGQTSLESRESSEESSSTYTESESSSTDSRSSAGSSSYSDGSTDSDVIPLDEKSKSKTRDFRRRSTKHRPRVIKKRVVFKSDHSYVPEVKRFLLPKIPGVKYNRAEFHGWDFGTKRQPADAANLPGLPETAGKLIDVMKTKKSDSMYDILFKSRVDAPVSGIVGPRAGSGSEPRKPPKALRKYPGFYAIAKPLTQYLGAGQKQRVKTTAKDAFTGLSVLPEVQPRSFVAPAQRGLQGPSAPSGSAGMTKLLERTRFPVMPSLIPSNQITETPDIEPDTAQERPYASGIPAYEQRSGFSETATSTPERGSVVVAAPDVAAVQGEPPLTTKDQTTVLPEIPTSISKEETAVRGTPPSVPSDQTAVQGMPPSISREGIDVQGMPPSISRGGIDVQGMPPSISREGIDVQGMPPSISREEIDVQGMPPSLSREQTAVQGMAPSMSNDQTDVQGKPPSVSIEQTDAQGMSPKLSREQTAVQGITPSISRERKAAQGMPPSLPTKQTAVQGKPPVVWRERTGRQKMSPSLSREQTDVQGIPPSLSREETAVPGMPLSWSSVPTIIIEKPPSLPSRPAISTSQRENRGGFSKKPPKALSARSSPSPASGPSETDRPHIQGSVLKEQSSLPAVLPSATRSQDQALPTTGKSEKPPSFSEGDLRHAGIPPAVKDVQTTPASSPAPTPTKFRAPILVPPSIKIDLAEDVADEDETALEAFLLEETKEASEAATTPQAAASRVQAAEAPSTFPLHIDMQGPCVDFFNVTRPDLVSMKYSAKHGIEELLTFLMYSIVIQRPQDPIDFLIDLVGTIRRTMTLRQASDRLVQDAKDYMVRTGGARAPFSDAAPASATDIFGQL